MKEETTEVKTGRFKTKRQYKNFVTGLKGKVRLLSPVAFLKAEKLSIMLEGTRFKITLCDNSTIDFEEVDTDSSNQEMIKRFIEEIDGSEVTGYMQKFVINGLEFETEDGKPCYLEVEHKKPIEKMFSLFDEKKEISTAGLSILDELFQSESDDQPTTEFKEPKKKKNSPKKSVSSDFMKESFEKMNLEKIQELKERILSKEEEIFKNSVDLERCESKNTKLIDELKTLNTRLKSLQPKDEPVGYDFYVSQENKTGIELSESLKEVVSKISPILKLNEDAVIDILTGGFYTITIQNQDGTEKVSKDIISKIVSIDPDSTIEILESNKFNYRGKMTWHQIVDSLIFKGFEQNPEFDKKCGSNSYESEETSK